MKNQTKSIVIYILILGVMIGYLSLSEMYKETNTLTEQYYYNNLLSDIENGKIDAIEIVGNAEVSGHGTALVSVNGEKYSVEIPSIDSFMPYVNEQISSDKIKTVETVAVPKTGMLKDIFFPLLVVLLVLIVISFVFAGMLNGPAKRGSQGGGSSTAKAMNFGKSKANLTVPEKNKTTFKDVAGLQEEKVELAEIVEFLKSPKKYKDIGARIPKGVLLVGPPGTGKTLLAKAVAGEAKAPFFSISGSDFVEMFAGVGASRVRDLFKTAKKHEPCLIFIDEIDAVGRKRSAGLGGGHDEREQTLNQLLVEMDGFSENEGIIILAATNRADILDPALLRPGRFDRQVNIGRPDVAGREEILKVHARNKKMSADVDLKVVAQTTGGFTGADLENLLNEAALISARHNLKEITMETIRKAFIKVGLGTEKKSRIVTEKERLITAYHESGHAILFEVLSELDPVHIVSIIPTGQAGGYTMPLPTGDVMYQTKTYMEQTIMSFLGGRVAEKIIFNEITTGASSDIERATKIATSMVTKFGMNDTLGPIQFGNDEYDMFLGERNSRNYGEVTQTKIDEEISKIIISSMEKVENILNENRYVLEASAKLLLEKEKISGNEFRALFKEGVLVEKESLKLFKDTYLDKDLDENLDVLLNDDKELDDL